MSIWEAVLLGLVQGLTEFLPVSSSGHLVIAQALLGVDQPGLTFEVVVHFATLLAVLVALKDDWYPIFLGLLGHPEHKEEGRRRFAALVAGSLPVALAGLLAREPIAALFASPRVAAAMLLVTGAILWASEVVARKEPRALERLRLADAVLIGCGQALAVIPGISRSGSTLAAGLAVGLERQSAARFAFLLAIPAILGAAALEVPELVQAGGVDWAPLAAGALSAGVSGYAAIALFLRFVRSGSLKGFAVYTWAAGLVALALV